MKINWFSPLPPAKSDISNYTLRIVPLLNQKAEVTLWTNTLGYDRHIQHYCKVKCFDSSELPWPEIHQARHNIYNIGNDARFHETIVAIQKKCPGIMILHDAILHDLVCSHILSQSNGKVYYLKLLEKIGGVEAKEKGQQLLDGKITLDTIARNYDLLEYIIEEPNGIITHNTLATKRIFDLSPAPILSTPLPFEAKGKLHPLISQEQINKKLKKPIKTLIVFGFLSSPNRRLDCIIDAFAQFAQKEHYRLEILGKINDRTPILQKIKTYHLQDSVKLRGYVTEQELQEHLDKADLAINLRNPTRKEASGSQLRIWNHSLPSLVSNLDWYATLPTNTVYFINPERETEDLHHHWSQYLNNPASYITTGINGRKHLELQHCSETFVENLLHFLSEVEYYQIKKFPYESLKNAFKSINLSSTQQSEWINRLTESVLRK